MSDSHNVGITTTIESGVASVSVIIGSYLLPEEGVGKVFTIDPSSLDLNEDVKGITNHLMLTIVNSYKTKVFET